MTLGRCPVCGSRQRKEVFVSHDWNYLVPGEFPEHRCLGCDAVYPDPQPTDESLGLYYPAGDYYAYSAASRHELFARPGPVAGVWYQIVRGILSRGYGYPLGGWGPPASVLRHVPLIGARATHELGILLHPWKPQGTLLDVGCGAGRYLDLMRALGWSRVVGVDISADAIANARSLGLEAYAGDLQEIGFPDNTFDAISASHTLEHVRDPLALLREIARVAKPGARVAIVVPNVRSLGSRIFRRHWVGLETPPHLVKEWPPGDGASAACREARRGDARHRPDRDLRVALFSMSRARGDPHSTYTDEHHRFGLPRIGQGAAFAVVEHLLCGFGR